MMKHCIQWIAYYMLVIGLCFLGLNHTVHAITITPTRHTLIMEKEQISSLHLDITNDTTNTITIVPRVESFSLSEKGTVQFGSPSDAISWIIPRQKTLTLESKEKKTILFDVTIPEIATPGARYLVLFAEEQGIKNDVQVTKRVGSLVFLYVEGEIQESLQQTMLNAKESLYFNNPIFVDIEYKNGGNIHVIPFGTIVIKNKKGEIINTMTLLDGKQKILAGDVWRDTIHIPKISWKHIGPLSIESQTTYGINQKIINQSTTVWWIPKEILITVLGVLSIFGISVGAIYMYGNYKKHKS